LLVNAGGSDLMVTVEGRRVRLGAYEVQYVPAPDGSSSVLRAARDGRYGTIVRLGAMPVTALIGRVRRQTWGDGSCLRPRSTAPWASTTTPSQEGG
jgi:hypothetical protein